MSSTEALVANGHLAMLPAAGTKNIPATNNNPISNDQTDLYGLEFWEGSFPIIDMGALHGPSRSDTIKQLGHACQHYGFFLLKNHGISETMISDIMGVMRDFFHDAEEDKMKLYSADPTGVIRFSTGAMDKSQNIFISRNSLKLHCHPVENYINLWPANPPSFREIIAEYGAATRSVELTLLEAIFEGLGMKMESKDKIMEKHGQQMSLNYYPICEKSDLEHTAGLRNHTDKTIVTLLLTNEVPGLEILQGEEWIPLKPIPNMFIAIVGDILQVLSNLRYKSLLHRVTANSERERLSITSYCYPSKDTQIGPPKELIDDDHTAIYKDFTYGDMFSSIAKARSPDDSYLESFKVCAA